MCRPEEAVQAWKKIESGYGMLRSTLFAQETVDRCLHCGIVAYKAE